VVDISLDGLQDLHDRIRGVEGTFERASRTLSGLVAISRTHPRLKPTVKMTILKDNFREILSVYEFARKTGAEFTTKPGSEFGFTGTMGDKSFEFTPEEAGEIIRQLQEIVARQRSDPLGHDTFWYRIYRQANIIFHRELIDYLRKRFVEKAPCAVGRCFSSSISILLHYDGKVYNCPTLLKPVGDLSRQSLEEIWWGEEMAKIRRFMISGKCSCFSQCDQMPALVLEHKRELIGGLFRRYSTRPTN
jgi:MoaA/NifB/PqqE/SkfB family radical SAM enzyme